MKVAPHSLLLSIAIGWLCVFQVDALAQQAQEPAAQAPLPADAAEAASPAAEAVAADDTAAAATQAPEESDGFRVRGENVVLHIGNDSHLAAGESADAVISVFGSSTSAGEVHEAVVSVFGNTQVTGPAHQGAIAIFGDTYVNSAVGEAAIAVFGNVQLGPQAEIDGDVVTIGGTISRDPRAVVHGDIQEISFGGSFGQMEGLRTWVRHCLLLGRPLAFAPGLEWAWGLAVGFLALYVLISLVFGRAVEKCVATLEEQPGQSVIAALLAMLLTPIVFVLLLATIVGIALIPFVGTALFCAGLFGKAVILAAIGRRLSGTSGIGAISHIAIATLIGGIIVLALYVVPVIGLVTYKLTGILGLGVVLYTLLLATRARRANGTGAEVGAAPATPAAAFAGTANQPGTGATPPPAEPAADAAGTTSTSAAPEPEPEPAAGAGAAGAAEPAGSAQAAGSAGAAAAGAAPAAPPASAAAISLPRAGFWIRMAALFIDTVLVAIIASILDSSGGTLLILLAAYGAVMWKLKATTVGGVVCNLRVVRLDGREMSWDTAVVRALGCFLSLAFMFLGFFWIAFDEERQSWHDKIAGTVVVRVPRGAALV